MAGFPKNIEFVLVFVFAVFNSSVVFVQSACVFERKGFEMQLQNSVGMWSSCSLGRGHSALSLVHNCYMYP